MIKPLFTLLVAIFYVVKVISQPELSFQHITPDNGLTGNYNFFVKQDSYGELWISSMEGVFRYNGLKMTHYEPEEGIAQGMIGKNVQSDFFEDSAGNIWFSTYSAINTYDRATNRFEALQFKNEKGHLIDAGYHLFYLERDSTLWLRVDGAICTYNIYTQDFSKLYALDYYNFSVQTDTLGRVDRIFACKMMGTDPLVILDVKNQRVPAYRNFQVNINETLPAFQSAYVQFDTLIWLCTDQGLLALNPEKLSQWKHYRLPSQDNQLLRRTISIDSQWLAVASSTQGLWFFDVKNRGFTKDYVNNETSQVSISGDNIRNVHMTPDRQLWLSYDQLKTLDHGWLEQNQFFNPFSKSGILSPSIESIVEDAYGQIWCATKSEGIFVFDKGGRLIQRYLHNALLGELNRIFQLSRDREGNIWAAAMRKILIFRHASQTWKTIPLPDDTQAYFLLHLSTRRKLVSTNQGIRELVQDGESFKMAASTLIPSSTNLDYLQLFEGQNERFYVPKNGNTLTYFTRNGNEKTHNINSAIYGVWEDEAQCAWLGTSVGLFRLNLATDSIQKVEISIANVKPGQIYGVQGDRKGGIWLNTDEGIWRYDPESGHCHVYTRYQDGSTFAEGMRYASLSDEVGNIWFGTSEGLIVFHPDSIHPFPGLPRVKIEALTVNNEPYQSLPNLDNIETLSLPYHQNNLAFTLVAVNQFYPEKNKIGYRIRNIGEPWQWVENGTPFDLPNLRPATYELEVKAINVHGVVGTSRTITIVIMKPFWLRWWFILLVLAVLFGIGYLIARAYVRRKLRQQQLIMERQQALQRERNRIAGELHDDLGWGLTRIQYISDNLIRLKALINNKNKLQQINDYARILLDDMSDIIWILDTETETIADWLASLKSDIYEFLELSDLSYQIVFPDNVPEIMLDRSWRRNALLAVKETLRNITRHAGATHTSIGVSIRDNTLHINIKDNGKGFDLGDLDKEKSGRGVQNILKRINALGGEVVWQKQNGTLVKINIPLPA